MKDYMIKEGVCRIIWSQNNGQYSKLPYCTFICKDSIVAPHIKDFKELESMSPDHRSLIDENPLFYSSLNDFNKIFTEKRCYRMNIMNKTYKSKAEFSRSFLGIKLKNKYREVSKIKPYATVSPLSRDLDIFYGDKSLLKYLKNEVKENKELLPFIEVIEPYFNFDLAYCFIQGDLQIASKTRIDIDENTKYPYAWFKLKRERDKVIVYDSWLTASQELEKRLDDQEYSVKNFNQEKIFSDIKDKLGSLKTFKIEEGEFFAYN